MGFGPVGVLLLIFAIWGTVLVVFWRGQARDGRAPADDIGFWWLLILSLYTTLPALSWWLQGGNYNPLTPRLYMLAPTAGDVTYLLLIAFAYALCFSAAYWPLRRRAHPSAPASLGWISDHKMVGAALIVGLTAALNLALSFFIPEAPTYNDHYRVIAELPLGLRQILKVLMSLGAVATYVLLIGILQRWPRHRVFLLFYIVAVLIAFDPRASRAGPALYFFALAIAWHVLVRPIRTRNWAIGGTVGLVAFLVIGLLRGFLNSAEIGAYEVTGLGLGELDALWANGVELLHALRNENIDVPFAARFGEFWAFVPSQFLPFEKGALSIWFVDVFHPAYKEAGGGWAFGAVSQAVIGGGIMEAAIRGVLLGVIAGAIFKWYRSANTQWWVFPIYLYLVVEVFQSIRDTTFRLIGDVVQVVVPSLFCIALAGAILASTRQPNTLIQPKAVT